MIKDASRDYATRAFRIYAELDKTSRLRLCENSISSPLAQDILAVDETLRELDCAKNGDRIKKAVTEVYFQRGKYSFAGGLISKRVKKVCEEIFVSEIQVYRYLKFARDLFCRLRGISTEADIALLDCNN